MADGRKSLAQRARDCENRAIHLGFTPYPSELSHWLSTIERLSGLVRELSERVERLDELESLK